MKKSFFLASLLTIGIVQCTAQSSSSEETCWYSKEIKKTAKRAKDCIASHPAEIILAAVLIATVLSIHKYRSQRENSLVLVSGETQITPLEQCSETTTAIDGASACVEAAKDLAGKFFDSPF